MIGYFQAAFWTLVIVSLGLVIWRFKPRLNHLKWRHLAAIGNNPFAKVSVIAPLVAPLALYTDKFAQLLNDHFALGMKADGLPWLYFSLLFLSAAQFVYNFRAPDQIKDFNNRNDYAANGGADMKAQDWSRISADLATQKLSSYGNQPFLVSSTDEFKEKLKDNRKNPDETEAQKACSALTAYFKKGEIAAKYRESMRDAINRYSNELFPPETVKTRRTELMDLLSLGKETGQTFTDEPKRRQLRTLFYDAQNNDRKISLYIVATLYLAGFSYFLWHIPNNIIKNICFLIGFA